MSESESPEVLRGVVRHVPEAPSLTQEEIAEIAAEAVEWVDKHPPGPEPEGDAMSKRLPGSFEGGKRR